jgi:hypothetical protein
MTTEAVVVYSKVLSQHLLGRTEKLLVFRIVSDPGHLDYKRLQHLLCREGTCVSLKCQTHSTCMYEPVLYSDYNGDV